MRSQLATLSVHRLLVMCVAFYLPDFSGSTRVALDGGSAKRMHVVDTADARTARFDVGPSTSMSS
jgi:hypothetical protein